VKLDRQRYGITWATFGHLYQDYYVFQYATGISGANALSSAILSGKPGSVDAYLGFLKAGSSKYPLDVLRQAGVDLASPQPVEENFPDTLRLCGSPGSIDQVDSAFLTRTAIASNSTAFVCLSV